MTQLQIYARGLLEINEWRIEPTPSHVPLEMPARILAFIQDKTEEFHVKTRYLIPPVDVKKWHQFVGTSELDAALLVLDQRALLYAEDAVIRGIVKIQPGTESVSTHHIIEILRIENHITQEFYEETLERMVKANIQVFAFSD